MSVERGMLLPNLCIVERGSFWMNWTTFAGGLSLMNLTTITTVTGSLTTQWGLRFVIRTMTLRLSAPFHLPLLQWIATRGCAWKSWRGPVLENATILRRPLRLDRASTTGCGMILLMTGGRFIVIPLITLTCLHRIDDTEWLFRNQFAGAVASSGAISLSLVTWLLTWNLYLTQSMLGT